MKKIKKLIYLGGIYSLGSLIEKGITFFFIPIYTTYLGTAEYGIIGMMSVTTGLILKFAGAPINQGFKRHFYSPEFKSTQGLLLFNSLILLTIKFFFLSLVFFWLSKTIASLVLKGEDMIFIVKTYALILFFTPIAEFLLNFLKQREKAKSTILISWAHTFIYSGIALSGLIYFELGVMALIYGILFGMIFKVFCIFPIFWRESERRISFSILSQPLKYGYPRIIAGCSSLLMRSGDRYIILIFSTISSVGLYNFGYQIAAIINIILVEPMTNALLPITFKQEGDPDQQKEFLRKVCTYYYLAGMFICLFISLYSKEIIEIIARKEEFWESWVIVPIIAYSNILVGLGRFFDWGLVMTKRGARISANVAIGALVNIGLNFLLIPSWGILGAAFATLISYLVLNGLRIYCSAKLYSLHFEMGRLLHITIVSFGLYALSLYVVYSGSLLLGMGFKVLLLFSFPLIIFITGFFNSMEKEYMKKLWYNIRINRLRETSVKFGC
jgi:O-antigen/teichoic acid export membrane protein